MQDFADWQKDLSVDEDSLSALYTNCFAWQENFVWRLQGAEKIPNPIREYFKVNGTPDEILLAAPRPHILACSALTEADMDALVTRGEPQVRKWRRSSTQKPSSKLPTKGCDIGLRVRE